MRWSSRTTLTFGALIVRIALLGDASSDAAPGDVDSGFAGFGTGGKIQNLSFSSFGAEALALDAQGRLVLTGSSGDTMRVQRRSGPRFATNETIDIVFDVGQISATGTAIAIVSDGKIVVVGTVSFEGGEREVAVARLNPDFTLDPSFDGDGTTIAAFKNTNEHGRGVAVQDDLKIVVVGQTFQGDSYEAGVVRLNEDGTLDAGFRGGGKFTFNVATFTSADDVVIQPDQKIVILGSRFEGTDNDLLVARLKPDGLFDEELDDDGIVVMGFGHQEDARDVTIGPNGEIVGIATYGDGSGGVFRLLPNGELDDGFDEDGKLSVTEGASVGGVAVQPDGKIVVARGSYAESDFVVDRYDLDGTLDETFGTGGEVSTTFLFGGARVAGLALQPDGMLVVAGRKPAARYRSDGSLDEGGIASIGFHPHHAGSEVTALGVDGDGRLLAAGKVYVVDYDMALARFTASGTGPDVSFGNVEPKAGRALYQTVNSSEEIRGLAIDVENQAAVAGQVFTSASGFFVGRFLEDGALALECGGFGVTTIDFGGSDASASAVYIRPFDTRIYAAGTARGTTEDYALVRLAKDTCAVDQIGGPTPDLYQVRVDVSGGDDFGVGLVVQNFGSVVAGSSAGNIVLMRETVNNLGLLVLDTGFGTNGYATADTGYSETAAALTEQTADGALVVAGTVDRGGTSDFLVARFNLHGAPDIDFGSNGFAFADFNAVDTAHAVTVRADGAIAVAGCTTGANGVELAVAQFTSAGDPDAAFSEDGKATLRIGTEDCAQAAAYMGAHRLVIGGYATIAGIKQFALAAFETTPDARVPTTTTTTTTTTVTTTSSTTTSLPTTTSTTTTTLPPPDCGDPNDDGNVTASDALFVLRTAVASEACLLCVCDTDNSSEITASDALRVLRAAVGQNVTLDCPTPCTAA